MTTTPELSAAPGTPARKTPPGAVWSLVLGILSLFCLWLLGSIPAIILGITSLKKAKTNPETTGGEGLSIAGIVTGSIGVFSGLFSVGMIAAVAMPAYMGFQEEALLANAQSNMRQVNLAILVYSNDHPEGEFPETLDQLVPDFLVDDSLFTVELSGGKSASIQYAQPGTDSTGDIPMLLLEVPEDSEHFIGYRDGTVEKRHTPIDPEILAVFR